MQYEAPPTSGLPNQVQTNHYGQGIIGQNNGQMN
jgi:hypothetical protein